MDPNTSNGAPQHPTLSAPTADGRGGGALDTTPALALDLSKPRYDMATYWGRVQHFGEITDMRLAFATDTVRDTSPHHAPPRFRHALTACPNL